MIIDPAGNGFDIGDLLTILGIITAFTGIVALLWKAVAAPQISKQIQAATQPIQPTANGGKSLPDVAANTELIKARQSELIEDIREMRQRFDNHLDNHK